MSSVINVSPMISTDVEDAVSPIKNPTGKFVSNILNHVVKMHDQAALNFRKSEQPVT